MSTILSSISVTSDMNISPLSNSYPNKKSKVSFSPTNSIYTIPCNNNIKEDTCNSNNKFISKLNNDNKFNFKNIQSFNNNNIPISKYNEIQTFWILLLLSKGLILDEFVENVFNYMNLNSINMNILFDHNDVSVQKKGIFI